MTTPITVVMIMGDAQRCIERALRSVAPWVDRMVVADTGANDASAEIARKCGAEVLRIPWNDDFAAARNAALAKAPDGWRVILDSDEWVAGGGEHLAALRHHSPDHVGRISVVSTYTMGDDVATMAAVQSRILPPEAQFTGRVHEYVPPGAYVEVTYPVVFGHDGFEPGRLEAGAARNERIGRAYVRDLPGDGRIHYWLARDMEALAQHPQAAADYTTALELTGPAEVWRHDLVVRALHCYANTRRFADAVALMDDEMDLWPHSPDFHYVVGQLFVEIVAANPQTSRDLIPLMEQSWKRCIAIGDSPELPGSVRGRGSFLAAHRLHSLFDGLGDAIRAESYRALAHEMRIQASLAGNPCDIVLSPSGSGIGDVVSGGPGAPRPSE